MKKLIAILAAAVLLALTGCGINADEPAPTEETTAETTGRSLEEIFAKIRTESLAGYSISVSELPEGTHEVPADWTGFTDSGISLKLPAEPEASVEDDVTTFNLKVDGSDAELIFESTEAAEKRLGDAVITLDSRIDVYQAAFEKLGIPFDGTKASLYRALLTVTPDDVDNADDETRSTLIEMGTELLYIDEAYIIEKEDAEVFIFHHRIPAADEGKDKEFYEALIFDSDDKQRDVRVFCDDKDTALRIAATADIAER